MSAAPVDAVESYLFSGVVKGENKVLGLAVSVYAFTRHNATTTTTFTHFTWPSAA